MEVGEIMSINRQEQLNSNNQSLAAVVLPLARMGDNNGIPFEYNDTSASRHIVGLLI